MFKGYDITSTDKRKAYNPHLTVAKVTNESWRSAKSIPPHTFQTHSRDVFGSEVIKEIELLSMTEPLDQHGYYHCFHRAPFCGPPEDTPTDTSIATMDTPIVTAGTPILPKTEGVDNVYCPNDIITNLSTPPNDL